MDFPGCVLRICVQCSCDCCIQKRAIREMEGAEGGSWDYLTFAGVPAGIQECYLTPEMHRGLLCPSKGHGLCLRQKSDKEARGLDSFLFFFPLSCLFVFSAKKPHTGPTPFTGKWLVNSAFRINSLRSQECSCERQQPFPGREGQQPSPHIHECCTGVLLQGRFEAFSFVIQCFMPLNNSVFGLIIMLCTPIAPSIQAPRIGLPTSKHLSSCIEFWHQLIFLKSTFWQISPLAACTGL